MKLSNRLTRKIVKYARDNPMIIILAIEETIKYAEQYEKENDKMFYKLFDIDGLSKLLKKYKKWINYKCDIDNDKIIELLIGSKFPRNKNIKEKQRYLIINKFILSL